MKTNLTNVKIIICRLLTVQFNRNKQLLLLNYLSVHWKNFVVCLTDNRYCLSINQNLPVFILCISWGGLKTNVTYMKRSFIQELVIKYIHTSYCPAQPGLTASTIRPPVWIHFSYSAWWSLQGASTLEQIQGFQQIVQIFLSLEYDLFWPQTYNQEASRCFVGHI